MHCLSIFTFDCSDQKLATTQALSLRQSASISHLPKQAALSMYSECPPLDNAAAGSNTSPSSILLKTPARLRIQQRFSLHTRRKNKYQQGLHARSRCCPSSPFSAHVGSRYSCTSIQHPRQARIRHSALLQPQHKRNRCPQLIVTLLIGSELRQRRGLSLDAGLEEGRRHRDALLLPAREHAAGLLLLLHVVIMAADAAAVV